MQHHVSSKMKLYATALVAVLLASIRPAAQAPARTVTPANPTILVGQTQQFTANGMSTPSAFASGGNHTCILMSDRSVRCFGQNNWGQLGNGSFSNSATPVAASGLTTAVSIGAGAEHTCAVLADGTMRCWGTSYVGQLGDGTFNGFSEVPKPVQNLTGAVAAVVGGFHTCAILSDRTMRCWGRNQDGQVGNGDNTTDVSVPQPPVPGLSGVVAATAGGYHTCALLPDRTVRCWGRNTRGQLGDGSGSFFSSTPVPVSGLTTATAVSGGGWHTCALLQNGTVQCWGENDSGQLGNTLPFSNVPVTVAGISNAVAISAGILHSCAILADGTTRCWGLNSNGQLGNGTTANSSSPVQVSGLSGPVQIALGGFGGFPPGGHSCVLMADRSGRCWGDNDFGQLGNGTTTDTSTPVVVAATGGLTWTSSNPAVATINSAGLATAVAAGTTTITATDGSGSASTTLTVSQPTSRFTLSTLLQGSGSGSVTSNPAGIACGADCTEDYNSGTLVTLTAASAAGSTFGGWTGCDSMSGATCTVTMNAARTVSASFTLAQQTFALTVNKSGGGGGSVTSSPAGITCGADCSEPYNSGTTVTLSAAAVSGSVFSGWSGCDSASGATCTVTMNAARSVSATFSLTTFMLTVSKPGNGGGTVTSSPAGINCGTDCSEPYNSGTSVTLTASAVSGSVFAGWTGCTSFSGTTCTVSMTAAKAVTATFSVQTYTLAVSRAGAGNGSVTSSPAGISCGADCSEPYTSGTTVTLTATAASGSVFAGWAGCNAVSGATCTVTMSALKSVTATFNLQFFTLTVTKSGLGGGTVTSSPAGIACGSTCSASYASNVVVTLTATPSLLSGFTGWSGCDSVSGNTCRVATSRARSVVASFRLLGLL